MAEGQQIQEVHQEGEGNMSLVDLNSVTSIGQDGQIILTGEDGHPYPVTVSGMLGVHNMYQTVVANISQLSGQNSDGTLQVILLVLLFDCISYAWFWMWYIFINL